MTSIDLPAASSHRGDHKPLATSAWPPPRSSAYPATGRRETKLQAFREAVANGPGGYVDDAISLGSPWGFALDQVKAPTRIMAATDD
jgi:hypothetical protein